MSHVNAIAKALADARVRDGRGAFIGYAELYCEGDRCPMREVEIHFKEYDDLLPSRLVCPACRRQLKLHHVQTLDEHEREEERYARSSVNAQLWRRAHPGDLAMPLGAFLNDRLPGDEPR